MLMKLKWETFQLRTVAAEPCKPGAEIEPGYHAFNCAVTAWHMADWVWQSASPQDRAELLSKLNIVATGKSRKDFGAFTKALMDRHRVLHLSSDRYRIKTQGGGGQSGPGSGCRGEVGY
jgi:hypothetical protein